MNRRGAAVPLDANGAELVSLHRETYEIEAEIDLTHLRESQAGFLLRVGPNEATRVVYEPAAQELVIDRTQAGRSDFHPDFAQSFRGHLEVPDGVLKLRIFVDRCSVEVFAQEGVLYGGALIFPSSGSDGLEFRGAGGSLRNAVYYPLS
jgi:fructan beta-fructosidase